MKIWLLIFALACSIAVASTETIVDKNTIKQLAEKANAGDADALETIANYYLVGFVVKKDLGKAEQLFRILVERTRPIATPDKPAELRRMGFALRVLSSLIEKDRDREAAKSMLKEAFDWLLKAALCGDPVAQTTLSEAYFRGDEMPKNELEAYAWEIVAARYHNNPSVKSELEVAVVNDAQRVDQSVWVKVVKRSNELIAQIEAAKK